MISGGIVAASAAEIGANFGKLLLAAFVLHVLGFLLGYAVSKVLGYSEDVARTVSIEVGMQNGGMAATLARKHFAAYPMAAAPAVVSGILQNVMGGLLAAWWSRSRAKDRQ
jgi:BASS family bile acid:Na+ symporter